MDKRQFSIRIAKKCEHLKIAITLKPLGIDIAKKKENLKAAITLKPLRLASRDDNLYVG